jgi:hypothetical protein
MSEIHVDLMIPGVCSRFSTVAIAFFPPVTEHARVHVHAIVRDWI